LQINSNLKSNGKGYRKEEEMEKGPRPNQPSEPAQPPRRSPAWAAALQSSPAGGKLRPIAAMWAAAVVSMPCGTNPSAFLFFPLSSNLIRSQAGERAATARAAPVSLRAKPEWKKIGAPAGFPARGRVGPGSCASRDLVSLPPGGDAEAAGPNPPSIGALSAFPCAATLAIAI